MIFLGWSKTKLVGLENHVILFSDQEAYTLFVKEGKEQPLEIQKQFEGAHDIEIEDEEAKKMLYLNQQNVYIVSAVDGKVTISESFRVDWGIPQ